MSLRVGSMLGACLLMALTCLMPSCNQPTCTYGISTALIDPAGSPCEQDCDCSNQRYEGYCLEGTCTAFKRSSCDAPGKDQECSLPSAFKKVFVGKYCPDAKLHQVCKPEGMSETYWGNCTCKSGWKTGTPAEPKKEPSSPDGGPNGPDGMYGPDSVYYPDGFWGPDANNEPWYPDGGSGPEAFCTDIGKACSVFGDCCSGYCNATIKQCAKEACSLAQGVCSMDTDCCSGTCLTGVCTG